MMKSIIRTYMNTPTWRISWMEKGSTVVHTTRLTRKCSRIEAEKYIRRIRPDIVWCEVILEGIR